MSSNPSVCSSGGNWSATDTGTPVRSEIVRPYSKRVIRRSGAGPGSSAQSGNDSCDVPSPPQAAASSTGKAIRAESLRAIQRIQSTDLGVVAQDSSRSELAHQAEGGIDDEAADVGVVHDRFAVARIGGRLDVAVARYPGQRQLERDEDVLVPDREPDLAAVVQRVALEAGEVGRVDARD